MLTWEWALARDTTVCVQCTHTLLYHNYYDSTKRILGCATVSRKEHVITQIRELEATKAVLPSVLEQNGIFHVFM
jgi:hypothetical protein